MNDRTEAHEDGEVGAVADSDETSDTGDDGQVHDRGGGGSSVFDRSEHLTLARVVIVIALFAVVLRVAALGTRTAHWDEARVAYWAYFYTETGSLAYYWEEHGPVAQLAAARLFGVLGVSDFTARLPVALVGGLLPLAALLYREHLRRSETVALALFLALNPVLLYYSRFMRSDVLLATFMFVALGLFVRFYDTRKPRYVLVAGVFVGLGFASKENAIVYVLTWLGASALVADQFLHSPASPESGVNRIRARAYGYRDSLRRAVYRADYAVGFALTFLLTSVVLFAPRGQGLDRRLNPDTDASPVTLEAAVRNPTELPALIDESLGVAYSGYMDWFAESEETTLETYLSFLSDYVMVLVDHAPLLVVFAIVGIVVERYARKRSRVLVMFMAYCGVASLIGYPLGSHIQGDSAWLSTHVVVPLAIPAAVGLSWAYHRVRRVVETNDVNPVAVLIVVVLLVGLWAWFVPVQSVYVDDTADDNSLVQFAQPHSDLGPLVETMDDIAGENDGVDVVFFYGEEGENFDTGRALVTHDGTGSVAGQWQVEPVCTNWAVSQPLNWYVGVAGVEGTCERSPEALADEVATGAVPIVITSPADETVPVDALEESYVEESYYLRNVGGEVVVYVHEDWAG